MTKKILLFLASVIIDYNVSVEKNQMVQLLSQEDQKKKELQIMLPYMTKTFILSFFNILLFLFYYFLF